MMSRCGGAARCGGGFCRCANDVRININTGTDTGSGAVPKIIAAAAAAMHSRAMIRRRIIVGADVVVVMTVVADVIYFVDDVTGR